MDDDKIIELFLARDERAVELTEKKYGKYCFRIANNILSDRLDSDECVNDTLERAWFAIPPNKPENLKVFLAKITRNLSIDKLRRKKSIGRGRGAVDDVLDELIECLPAENVDEVINLKELEATIDSFLSTISSRDRKVFLRRYFFAQDIAEIAEMFNLKESHVLVILSRVRRKMKIHLKKEGYAI